MTALDCPVCNAPFKEVVRDGVLIDICTHCQGIWLDKGELERMFENATAAKTRPLPERIE